MPRAHRRLACPARRDVARRAERRRHRARSAPRRRLPARWRRRSMPSSWRAVTSGSDCGPAASRAEPTVIPLAHRADRAGRSRPRPFDVAGPMVAVLGLIYPGKGHAAVLEALSTLPRDVALWALGAVSDGHDDLLGELERFAVRARRRIVVTGLPRRRHAGRSGPSDRRPGRPCGRPVGVGVAGHVDRRRSPAPRPPTARTPASWPLRRPSWSRATGRTMSGTWRRRSREPWTTLPRPSSRRRSPSASAGRPVAAQHRAVYRGVADRRG